MLLLVTILSFVLTIISVIEPLTKGFIFDVRRDNINDIRVGFDYIVSLLQREEGTP